MNNNLRFFLLIVVVLSLTSCATIALRNYYTMSISSDLPKSEAVVNQTNRYQLPSRVAVPRSSENLSLTILQNDTIVSDTTLTARLNNHFLWGNLGFLYVAPLGWLVDLSNERRFTYGQHIHVDTQGNIRQLNRAFSNKYAEVNFRNREKGNFSILLAIPHFNIFRLEPQNEIPVNNLVSGFIGFGAGMEYFYRSNRSLQLRSDVVTTRPPIALTILTPWWGNKCTAFNVNLTDNFHTGRFRLGYGLNFARHTWSYRGYYSYRWQEEEKYREWIPKVKNMLGLALSAHYRFGNHFHLGVIYRPSFLNLSRPHSIFESTVSLDFMWKIPL